MAHRWSIPRMLLAKPTYPLVICYIAIENGPVEIVDLLSYKMVDLSSSLCGCLPEGISTNIPVFGLIEPLESPLNTIKPY